MGIVLLRPRVLSRAVLLSLSVSAIIGCTGPTGEEQKAIQRAEIYLRNKQYAKAITDFEKVLAVNPASYPASIGLARCYLAKKEFDRARESFRRSAELDPESADPWLGLVEVALAGDSPDPSAALTSCAEAIRREPARADARSAMGSILRLQGKNAEAIEVYREAVRLEPKDSRLRVFLAQSLMQEGRTAEAERLLIESLKENLPNAAAIRTALSRILEMKGSVDEALGLLEDTEGKEVSASLRQQRGRLYLRASRDPSCEPAKAKTLRQLALRDGEALLAANRQNLIGIEIKGIALFDNGSYSDALLVFQEVRTFLDRRTMVPTDFPADMRRQFALLLLHLGRCYMETDLPRKGNDEFVRAMVWDPEGIDPFFWSAMAQLQTGDRQGAVTAVERMLQTLGSGGDQRRLAAGRELYPPLEDRFLRMVEQWVEEDPIAVSPLIAVAQLHLRLGKPEECLRWCARASERDPNRPETHFVRGLALLQLAQYGAALDTLRKASEVGPEYLPPYLLLADIYLQGRRPDLAIRQYQAASQHHPDDIRVPVGLARAYAVLGDEARSIGYLKGVLERAPDNEPALELLTAIYVRRGRVADPVAYEEMIALCDQILERSPRSEWALMVKAEALIRRGDLEGAESILESLAEAVPTSVPRWATYASVLALNGKLEAAREAIADAQQIAGATADLAIVEGIILILNDEPGEAIKVLGAPFMLEQLPDISRVMTAQCHLALGNREEGFRVLESVAPHGREEAGYYADFFMASNSHALEDAKLIAKLTFLAYRGWWTLAREEVRKLVERAPDKPLSLWWQAEVARNLRQFDAAYPHLLRLVELAPYSGRGWITLAGIEAATNPLKAVEYYQRAIPLFAGDIDWLTRIHFQTGQLLEQTGRKEEAAQEYRLALEQRPGFGLAANNLAWLLMEEKREEARKLAEAAVRALPSVGAIRDTLGWICFLDGDLDEALEELRLASSLDPYQPSIRYHTARAFREAGDIARAMAELRLALAIGVDFPEKGDTEMLLQELAAASGD